MYENKPIMSILSDQSITLDFVNSTSSSKTESAFTRTKVRIEAILKLLTQNLSSNMIQVIPYPIANFLNKITEPQSYIPDDYLWDFEKDRVNLNEDGVFQDLDVNQKQVIYLFFIMGRLLVSKVLLDPQAIAQNVNLK